MVTDDEQFSAALVSLGSLGVVFGVIVETVPLYQLKFSRLARPWNDQQVWQAIRTLDTSALHPETQEVPYHFDVVMHPYPPDNAPGLYATMMWKQPATGLDLSSPLPSIPLVSSDLMSLIGKLTQSTLAHLSQPLTLDVLRGYISSQLANNASATSGRAFPGQMFGPTTLPPGTGASTEIAVDHGYTEFALNAVYKVLQERANAGRFLLGCIGVRFVPANAGAAGHEHRRNELLHRATEHQKRRRPRAVSSGVGRARSAKHPVHVSLGSAPWPDGARAFELLRRTSRALEARAGEPASLRFTRARHFRSAAPGRSSARRTWSRACSSADRRGRCSASASGDLSGFARPRRVRVASSHWRYSRRYLRTGNRGCITRPGSLRINSMRTASSDPTAGRRFTLEPAVPWRHPRTTRLRPAARVPPSHCQRPACPESPPRDHQMSN